MLTDRRGWLSKAFTAALYFLAIAVAALWTAFCAVVSLLAFCVSEPLGHRWHRRWGRGCLALIGVKVTYVGLESLVGAGSVILAANHESMWDIMVLAAMPYNFKWIAKKEVSRLPLFGTLFRKMGSFYVTRDRTGKDINVMREVEEGLRRGKSIAIFPEGTRTRDGALLPFKKGAFRASQQSGRPIIPVALTGTFRIAPPGESPSSRGHHVVARFGPPLLVRPATPLAQAMEAYRLELLRLMAHDRQR